MKLVRYIGESKAFKKFGGRFYSKPLPPCRYFKLDTDEYWECYVRHMATTDHHPVGTCKMGPEWDDYAVVDNRWDRITFPSLDDINDFCFSFNVYGVKGLRVVDGSTMPVVPSGNINIPIIMMAERAADFIKQDYLYHSP